MPHGSFFCCLGIKHGVLLVFVFCLLFVVACSCLMVFFCCFVCVLPFLGVFVVAFCLNFLFAFGQRLGVLGSLFLTLFLVVVAD